MIPPSDAADKSADNFDRLNAISPPRRLGCTRNELRQMRAERKRRSSLGGRPYHAPNTACSA